MALNTRDCSRVGIRPVSCRWEKSPRFSSPITSRQALPRTTMRVRLLKRYRIRSVAACVPYLSSAGLMDDPGHVASWRIADRMARDRPERRAVSRAGEALGNAHPCRAVRSETDPRLGVGDVAGLRHHRLKARRPRHWSSDEACQLHLAERDSRDR